MIDLPHGNSIPPASRNEEKNRKPPSKTHVFSRILTAIPYVGNLFLRKEISRTDMMILWIIDDLVSHRSDGAGWEHGKGCYAKNKYFADSIGTNVSYISRRLTELKDQGLVVDVRMGGRRYLELSWSRTNKQLLQMEGRYGELLREDYARARAILDERTDYLGRYGEPYPGRYDPSYIDENRSPPSERGDGYILNECLGGRTFISSHLPTSSLDILSQAKQTDGSSRDPEEKETDCSPGTTNPTEGFIPPPKAEIEPVHLQIADVLRAVLKKEKGVLSSAKRHSWAEKVRKQMERMENGEQRLSNLFLQWYPDHADRDGVPLIQSTEGVCDRIVLWLEDLMLGRSSQSKGKYHRHDDNECHGDMWAVPIKPSIGKVGRRFHIDADGNRTEVFS